MYQSKQGIVPVVEGEENKISLPKKKAAKKKKRKLGAEPEKALTMC